MRNICKLMKSGRARPALSPGGEGARPAAGAGSLPAGDAGVRSSALGCPPGVPRAPVPAVPDPPSAATSPVPAAAPGTPCAQTCPPLRLDRAAGSPGRERRFRLSPLDPQGHACGNQPHGPVHSLASNALNAKKAKKKESKRQERMRERPEPVGLSGGGLPAPFGVLCLLEHREQVSTPVTWGGGLRGCSPGLGSEPWLQAGHTDPPSSSCPPLPCGWRWTPSLPTPQSPDPAVRVGRRCPFLASAMAGRPAAVSAFLDDQPRSVLLSRTRTPGSGHLSVRTDPEPRGAESSAARCRLRPPRRAVTWISPTASRLLRSEATLFSP